MATRIQKSGLSLSTLKLEKLLTIFEQWSINFDTRKQLKNMDDSQLRDIGIDRVIAEKEAAKPFWQL